MRIFLTGGSGFIGKKFINVAIAQGHKVFAVSRKKKKKKKNLVWLGGEKNFKWNELKKSDLLIHLASYGVADQNLPLKKCLDINLYSSIELLMNAKNLGCKNWILVGSSSEFGETLKLQKKVGINCKMRPTNNYAISKYLFYKAALKLAKEFKVNCRYARVFQVYGPNERKNRLIPSLFSALKKGKVFYVNQPNSVRDFISVDDVVIKILEMTKFKKKKTIETWHIGNGKPLKIKDFVLNLLKKKFKKNKIKKVKFKKNVTNYENHVSIIKNLWVKK